jgi:hypothetical protein
MKEEVGRYNGKFCLLSSFMLLILSRSVLGSLLFFFLGHRNEWMMDAVNKFLIPVRSLLYGDRMRQYVFQPRSCSTFI